MKYFKKKKNQVSRKTWTNISPGKQFLSFVGKSFFKKSSNLENLSTKEAKETVMELALNLNVMYIVGDLLKMFQKQKESSAF